MSARSGEVLGFGAPRAINFYMEIEENENGGLSGSDTRGSVGSDNGSDNGIGGSGSGGSVDGSNGSVDGSGGSVDGSGGNDRGSADGSANRSADILDIKSSDGNSDRDKNNAVRESRADRERGRKPIRLGSADRNRNSDSSTGRDRGSADESTPLADEPVIRLGSRKQGRPRAEAKADNATELKLSEMKDLISMFIDSIFEIPAVTLQQSFWRLEKEENKALTEAISAYIKSMPKSKSSWLMEAIQQHLPLVNLIMVGFFIVSDRTKKSIAIAQVTKAGRQVAQTLGADTPKATAGASIRTPLDNMF